jgi:5'-3' exonuclease
MVYLIDASVYVFRAWHSMPPELADSQGNPTHALYGFARFLGDLLERERPRYIAVAFDDTQGNSFRHRLYPRYKANREAAPEALRRQFALCREFCRHLGIAEFASGEYEADDLIGSLARVCRGQGLRVTVVSRDKDLAQLVGPGDVFWDYSGSTQYHYHEIAERFGATPERMADYLALRGDSVDNIPGVPGIGPKTAAALMGLFGSLDELFERLELVADLPVRGAAVLADRLRTHRDAAYLAQALTRIACHVPLTTDRTDLLCRPPDLERIHTFCDRHGFGSGLRRQAERLAAARLAA